MIGYIAIKELMRGNGASNCGFYTRENCPRPYVVVVEREEANYGRGECFVAYKGQKLISHFLKSDYNGNGYGTHLTIEDLEDVRIILSEQFGFRMY